MAEIEEDAREQEPCQDSFCRITLPVVRDKGDEPEQANIKRYETEQYSKHCLPVCFFSGWFYNNHEAQTLRICFKLDSIAGFILACTILYRLCILMSNSALIPKAASITRAISLVIGRLLLRISFSIVYEISVREANSFWDILLASNSSLTTSPGCVGILYVVLSISQLFIMI